MAYIDASRTNSHLKSVLDIVTGSDIYVEWNPDLDVDTHNNDSWHFGTRSDK